MWGQAGGGPDFPQEPLGGEHRGDVGPEHLQRHRPLVLQVAGEPHRGHPAPTDLPLEGVAVAQGGAEARQLVDHVMSRTRTGPQSIRLMGIRGQVRGV